MNHTTAIGQEFTASVWREGQWYVAQALEIDIASQGESVEAALDNLREAIELHFEDPIATAMPKVHKVRAKVPEYSLYRKSIPFPDA